MARASLTTTLSVGTISVPIAAFRTTGDPSEGVHFEQRRDDEPVEVTQSGRVLTNGDIERLADEAESGYVMNSATGFSLDDVSFGAEADTAPAEKVASKIHRGVVLDDGTFVDVTTELEKIDEFVKMDSMGVVGFIDGRRVPREAIMGSYWIGVRDHVGAKVLRLLRDAMRATGRVAYVRFSKTKNVAQGILMPHRSGALLLVELAFVEQTRSPVEHAAPLNVVSISDSELGSAIALIRALSDSPVVLAEAEDDRHRLRRELYNSALAGRPDEFALSRVEAEIPDAIEKSLRAAVGAAA